MDSVKTDVERASTALEAALRSGTIWTGYVGGGQGLCMATDGITFTSVHLPAGPQLLEFLAVLAEEQILESAPLLVGQVGIDEYGRGVIILRIDSSKNCGQEIHWITAFAERVIQHPKYHWPRRCDD